ncbi:hypothetical protein L1987_47491 [Smallanthus sonchifolius]|uniref:Uncharacterized protein n=1 Tax=Smallanthus sonchifolius TaxID=185202 RepID=A0ACB9G2T4_9ASTR|nr:hypothetical protein L1987_47491 [Smallanthus sonchifolius]
MEFADKTTLIKIQIYTGKRLLIKSDFLFSSLSLCHLQIFTKRVPVQFELYKSPPPPPPPDFSPAPSLQLILLRD